MAKTTINYQNDGYMLAMENKPRPTGNSWQAKAMQQGWDNCSSAMGLEYSERSSSMDYNMFIDPFTSAMPWKMPKDVQKIKDTRNAVESHIDKLRYMATIATSQREYRINRKIFKLEQKHSSIL